MSRLRTQNEKPVRQPVFLDRLPRPETDLMRSRFKFSWPRRSPCKKAIVAWSSAFSDSHCALSSSNWLHSCCRKCKIPGSVYRQLSKSGWLSISEINDCNDCRLNLNGVFSRNEVETDLGRISRLGKNRRGRFRLFAPPFGGVLLPRLDLITVRTRIS